MSELPPEFGIFYINGVLVPMGGLEYTLTSDFGTSGSVNLEWSKHPEYPENPITVEYYVNDKDGVTIETGNFIQTDSIWTATIMLISRIKTTFTIGVDITYSTTSPTRGILVIFTPYALLPIAILGSLGLVLAAVLFITRKKMRGKK